MIIGNNSSRNDLLSYKDFADIMHSHMYKAFGIEPEELIRYIEQNGLAGKIRKPSGSISPIKLYELIYDTINKNGNTSLKRRR